MLQGRFEEPTHESQRDTRPWDRTPSSQAAHIIHLHIAEVRVPLGDVMFELQSEVAVTSGSAKGHENSILRAHTCDCLQ